MKCPRCGHEAEMLFSDGCLSCHEKRTEMLRASLARVETGAASPPKPKPTVIPPEKKEPKPMPTEEPTERRLIRWDPEEYQQVAAEVARLFPGRPFAAKAVKEAQACLPADRRKPGIAPNDLKKIRALIPGAGAKASRGVRGRGKEVAKVSRRAPAKSEAVILRPVTDALPAAESLADSIAQQLVSAVINVGVSALEKAAGRLRSVSA